MSWQWLPSINHPPPRHILHKDGISHPQSDAPLGTDLIPARAKFISLLKTLALPRESQRSKRQIEPSTYERSNEAGVLFGNHHLDASTRLFYLTLLWVSSNLKNAARHTGKHLADAVEPKKNKYRGSFPATYSLLPFTMSTRGEVGSIVHALIKELAIRRVEHRSETNSNEFQHLAEGAEVARLQWRLSYLLLQALSLRTRHHICR